MEMDRSVCHSSAVPHVNVQLSVVEEVLRERDAVGYVVAARAPLPALHRHKAVSGVVTAALWPQLSGWARRRDAVYGGSRGESVDEGFLGSLCKVEN